jgi:hypothetical protein
MKQSVIVDELQFHADKVEAHEVEYTPDFIVYGIYFGEGDPEQGGQHWNFTNNSDDEDEEGVCIVKEIQEVTVYGGIDVFNLTRKSLTCNFDNETAKSTKIRRLLITYEIDDETWEAVVKQSQKIFAGESYFHLMQ